MRTWKRVNRCARWVIEFAYSRRARKIALILVLAVAAYGLLGFFGMPILVRHIASGTVANSLRRHVSVGHTSFNPYTLTLNLYKLHINEHDSPQLFVDVVRLHAKISWSSLFRLAPIVSELTVDQPTLNVIRIDKQQFNFSDLIEFNRSPTATKSNKPTRFAVSNIQINNGEIHFDDRVLGQHHEVAHLQIGVPFVANLPAINIYVKPRVQMVVDGSPLQLAGRAKLFSTPPESVLDLNLRELDLARYAAYIPPTLMIKLPHGALSCAVQVHFVAASPVPLIRLTGEITFEQIDLRDGAGAPLLLLQHASAALNDVQPLRKVAAFGEIHVDGLTTYVVRNRNGSLNLTSLAAKSGTLAASPGVATPPATAVQAQPVPTSSKAGVSVQSLTLTGGTANIIDNTGAKPATLTLKDIHVLIKDLHTLGTMPAALDMSATLNGGGSIAVKGTLDLPQSKAAIDLTLDQVNLPALQAFAHSVLAAELVAGKLTARVSVRANFPSGRFNVHVELANFDLDQVQVRASSGGEAPVAWSKLSATIGQFDLATHQTTVNEVRADRLHLFVRRQRNGQLNLISLIRGAAPSVGQSAASVGAIAGPRQGLVQSQRTGGQQHKPKNAAAQTTQQSRQRPTAPSAALPSAAGAPAWHWRVASLVLANNDIHVVDDSVTQPVDVTITPLNLHITDASSEFTKPVGLEADGVVNRRGSFKISGNAALKPLKADLHVNTRLLDLAVANPYVADRLNATITQALLTINGAFGMADERGRTRVSYQGNATLGNVRLLDKVTSRSFARWGALNLSRIDFRLGQGNPHIHVAALSLADFYGRVILYSNGRMNLSNLLASPQAPPVSLTNTNPSTTRAAPQLLATPPPVTSKPPPFARAGKPLPADIAIGGITLAGGNINYTDNFIKPNYSANLTQIIGKVGAFGTASTFPANVELRGHVNGSAPLEINGLIDPLSPMAFLDIKAKANGVEMTPLTPYSSKYIGYPITKGMLSVNVRYLLERQKLIAQNHIVMDQLTLGPKVESPNALNLPIRLAVAMLKNPQGQIDVNIPVSGSLSDPNFRITDVILQVFKNLILRATAEPFKLLASIVGGFGESEQLEYVEFEPGYATLTPESQKKLETIAKALKNRPALELAISGRVDPKYDREGLRDAILERLIKRQKIKQLESQGKNVNPDSIGLTTSEYQKYLKRVYKAANFDKPRDFLGFEKSLPPEEMKRLLLTQIEVTDNDLKHLADARANAVRQWLSKQVDPARLFITTPKLNAEEIKDKGKTTRVDLSLD